MTVPNWKANARLVTELSVTDTVVGTFAGIDADGLSVVSFGFYPDGDGSYIASSVSVQAATRYRPRVGEPVVLTWTNGRLRLTGPARAKSSRGVVVSVANPLVTVTCEGATYTLPFAVSTASDLAAGKPVAIDWDYGGGYVKDVLSTATTDPDAPPKLTSDQRPFTLYFFAKQSGSYKSSKWWTEDVRATDADDEGAWWYGNVIRKTLRDDAYIASVEVFLPPRSTGGGLPRIGRHTQDSRPSGSLTVSDDATRGDRAGWVRLPTAWAETWRSNAGGVAVKHGGSNVYKGIHANRQSGKLRIRGRQ